MQQARDIFDGTGITIRSDGASYLGAPIGSPAYCQSFVQTQAAAFAEQVDRCALYATTQPHAAYTVATKALTSRWRYTTRATLCAPDALAQIDGAVDTKLLPALLGQPACTGGALRTLIAAPARQGGMALPIVSQCAVLDHDDALRATAPIRNLFAEVANGNPPQSMDRRRPAAPDVGATPESHPGAAVHQQLAASPVVAMLEEAGYDRDGALRATAPASIATAYIARGDRPGSVDCQQSNAPPVDVTDPGEQPRPADNQRPTASPVEMALGEARSIAREVATGRRRRAKEAVAAVRNDLSPPQQLLTEVAGQPGVSSWLTARPSLANGTVLKTSDFRDALCIRYSLPLDCQPSTCVCGSPSTMDHMMTCPTGGYPSARHDHLRDIIAEVMSEMVRDVETEPVLTPLQGEDLPGRALNRAPEARLDIRARGFWTRQQDAYFDVRVTHPKEPMLSCPEALRQLRHHERLKKQQYCARVTEVERGTFTPLVFLTNGMAAPECGRVLSAIAGALAAKNTDVSYSTIISEIRVRISFCLLRWAVTCFRGCRGSYRQRARVPFLAQCRQRACRG